MKFLTLLFILMFYRIRTTYGWPTSLGCFLDKMERALPYHAGNGIRNLIVCIGKCRDQGMRYAGVHLGHQCYCGNDWPNYGFTNPCDYKCEGGEACGGLTWAMTVYTVCQNTTYWSEATNTCVPCSTNCFDPVCHQGKGDCKDWKCKAEWKGALCDTTCEDGGFGSGCSKSCGKCLEGPCHDITGECPNGNCKHEGYRPKSCTECLSVKYGDDCQHDCGNCNSEGCNNATGNCIQCSSEKYQTPKCKDCAEGRYGASCDNFCGNCLNGQCDKETGECPDGQCQQGYKEPLCQENLCPSGQYAPDCQSCGNCKDGTCDQITGTCPNGECAQGYEGPTCHESLCPNGHYGPDCKACGKCVDGQSCDIASGECNNGCKHDGYRTPLCQECTSVKYGNDCQQNCGYCYENERCHISSGDCGRCREDKYLTPKCLDCADGRYGSECSDSCGHCINNVCDKSTGKCDSQGCETGYQGEMCKQECPEGKHGYNCESNCGYCATPPCNTQTGTCEGGCQAGYKGDTCETACADNEYGPNCDQFCGNCSNPVCDNVNGHCNTDGCQAGYKGDLCKTACADGFYGENCAMKCGECMTFPCDGRSGICTNGECKEGYKGTLCKNQKCDDGKYGPPLCNGVCGQCIDNACNEDTGVCGNGCNIGYQGENCDSACDDGKYGLTCVESCGKCANPVCDKVTGKCDKQGCQAGYKEKLCKTECEDGFYGNCSQPCGQCMEKVCNKVTGYCSKEGCKDSWNGNQCQLTDNIKGPDEPKKEGPPMPMIGGAIGALLVIAIIIIVVVVVLRHRRRTSKDKEDECENNAGISTTGTNHYAEVKETNGSLKGAHALEMAETQNRLKKIENINIKKDKPEKPPTSPKRVVPSTSGGQEDIYENTSKLLKVEEIEGYVNDMKATEDGFENEFRKIPSDKLAAWTIASNPSLKPKNRFKNIWPYDHSRVHLQETPGVAGSDYINACHIGGYKSPRKYIATQGPMDRTVNDFWRMIWEQNVTRIVMVANIYEDTKKKCEMYWPDYGKTETHGKFTVKNTKEENFKGFVVRTMKLSMEQESSDAGTIYNNESGTARTVIQFHFTDWPDKGVPLYCTALVSFHRKVKAMSEKVNSPIVVHCSAGIGRTGTYIALDYLTDQCHAEGVVDVFQCVVNLRKDRFNMVQTKHQYIFLYETLFESLTTGVTLIPCFKFSETYEQLQKPEKGKTTTGLDAQYKIVKAHIQKVLKDRSLEGALDPENESKNRSQETLPGDNMRVNVMLDEPGRNRYINAVFAENYFKRNGLHLTQLPLGDTVIDFWRMVQGYNVNTIVSLSNPQEDSFKTSKFWPAGTADKVISGPFTITRKEMSQQGTVDCCHLVLAYKKEERTVFLVSVSNWADDKWMPNDINTMYDIHNNVQTWQQGHTSEGQTVIQCYDGGMKSGMYAVVSWMFDMINSEQEVDIFQITKQILLARPGFLTKMEQYKDLYKIAQDYMDKFQNYSNFK